MKSQSLMTILLLLAWALAACGAARPSITPTPAVSLLPSAIVSSPPSPTATRTLLPTATATYTPRPIATRPPLTPTATPWPTSPVGPTPTPGPLAIQPGSLEQLTLLAQLGRGAANDFAWSPDGRYLAVASSLGVYLFDAGTLEQVDFIETGERVSAIAFRPTGSTLAVSIYDSIQLWDIDGHSLSATLDPNASASSRTLLFSPGGTRLAVVEIEAPGPAEWGTGTGYTLTVWDVPNRQVLFTERGGGSPCRDLDFSADGSMIAFSFGVTDLLDSQTGEVLRTFWQGSYSSYTAFSADGRLMFLDTGGEDEIQIWDAQQWQLLGTLPAHGNPFLSPDGRTLAVYNFEDGGVRLWDIETASLLFTLEGSNRSSNISFSPDGLSLATISEDETVRIWSTATGERLHDLPFESVVYSLAFNPNPPEDMPAYWLAAGYQSGRIDLWDIGSRQLLQTLDAHAETVSHLTFSPDGYRLASVGWDGSVRTWEPPGELPVIDLQDAYPGFGTYFFTSFTPDGETLVTGGGDHGFFLRAWDAQSGQYLSQIELSQAQIFPDQNGIGSDGRLVTSPGTSVWSLALYRPLVSLPGDLNASAEAFAVSADGQLAASAPATLPPTTDSEANISIWNLETGELMWTLQGHDVDTVFGAFFLGVHTLAFSPNADLLASIGDDGTVRLWNPRTGQPLYVLEGPCSNGQRLAFSPDGRYLVIGRWDGLICVWGIGP